MSEELATVTIYDSPVDFPGKFVVRRFWVGGGTLTPEPLPLAVTATLHQARAHVPGGMYCMGRMDADDTTIVETWI